MSTGRYPLVLVLVVVLERLLPLMWSRKRGPVYDH
jgi:hypothetical protein